jgi:glycosyltransferase involved in cell wall biosynthesis
MTRALRDAGVEAEVATTDDDGDARLPVPYGSPQDRGGVPHWFFPRQTRFYKFSLPLTRWLAQNVARYDALHIHALFTYASMPAAFFAARRGVPYIVRPLGTLNRFGMEQYHRALKRVSFPLIEKRILARAAFLHFTSEMERAQAAEVGVRGRSAVIPTGVAPGEATERGAWLRQNAPPLSGRTLYLYLGRLDPKKGLDVLMPAFAQLKTQESKAALVIAGSGEAAYDKELRALCVGLGIANDVVFAGYVEGAEKDALLRDADVFVLPSRSENQGVAVVEAMAAGLPVIVSPHVGIAPEIVENGAGMMAEGEAAPFAEAMLELARDETRRIEQGLHAKKLARERFSIEGMTRALIELYQRAMELPQ